MIGRCACCGQWGGDWVHVVLLGGHAYERDRDSDDREKYRRYQAEQYERDGGM